MFITMIFAAGCGGATEGTSQPEATAKAPGTLTFTTKDPEKGLLSGTFEYDGYTILFDVARGEENPWIERAGGGTAYSQAIDARLCDEQHFCFSQQAGSHSFADQGWAPNNSETNAPDNERTLKNNRTMWKLHQHLMIIGNKDFKGLEEEVGTLANISNTPPEEWGIPAVDVQKEKLLNLGTPQKGVLALSAVAATGTYTQRFHIWWQYVGGSLGEHSSTWTRVYTASGSLTNQLTTCNHGACANQSGMSPLCTKDFTNRVIYIPYSSQCVASTFPGTMHTSASGCCMSPYNVLPGLTPSHVCNDDSRFQRDYMIQGSVPQSSPYCADIVTAIYAPMCN